MTRLATVSIAVFCLLLYAKESNAKIRLPAIFGDSMVLQRRAPIPVWGSGRPGEKVAVRFRDQIENAVVDNAGKWKVFLDKQEAGGPFELVIKGENEIVFRDVLVGEVWLCSGQSNMAFRTAGVYDAEKELTDANYPEIRHAKVPLRVSGVPLDDSPGIKWKPSSADNAKDFTAVGFFFARMLYKELGIPIGLIHASWGGTIIEAWTSREALEKTPGCEKLMREFAAFPADSLNKARPKHTPTLLFNAMIYPLIPYGIRGALWYQGENNAYWAYQYRSLMPALINDWRGRWNQGGFPFYIAQLSSFKANGGTSNGGSTWAELREAQSLARKLPQVEMAVTYDIGETEDVHPRNKQDVGKRFAQIAFAQIYPKKVGTASRGSANRGTALRGTAYLGPALRKSKFSGNRAVIFFSNSRHGLVTKDGAVAAGFEVAGNDRHFYPAEARITGKRVTVKSPKVPKPEAVRYAWADDALGSNLHNKQGLPAEPFRTDQWKLSSEGRLHEEIVFP